MAVKMSGTRVTSADMGGKGGMSKPKSSGYNARKKAGQPGDQKTRMGAANKGTSTKPKARMTGQDKSSSHAVGGGGSRM